MVSKFILVLTGLAIAGLPAAVVSKTEWLVRGEAIVTCPCKTPCPCRSNAHASQPHCENLSYVHVVQGRFGRTKLDGLQYVWAADECQGGPRSRKETQLYFGNSTTKAQASAIECIMSGEDGPPASARGIKITRGELTAHADGALYSVRISRLVDISVNIAPGVIAMEPLPALDSWGNTVTYARNIKARIDDPAAGLKWDYSGLQANYRTFEIGSDAVEHGLLLAQFRDDSGHFNEMHRSLIQEQHLQVPLDREGFQQMLAQVHAPGEPGRELTTDSPSGSIGGVITGSDGRPRSGARIHLMRDQRSVAPIAVANASGRYFISRVSPGNYSVCAVSWDGKQQEQSCEAVVISRSAVVEHNQALAVVSR